MGDLRIEKGSDNQRGNGHRSRDGLLKAMATGKG